MKSRACQTLSDALVAPGAAVHLFQSISEMMARNELYREGNYQRNSPYINHSGDEKKRLFKILKDMRFKERFRNLRW